MHLLILDHLFANHLSYPTPIPTQPCSTVVTLPVSTHSWRCGNACFSSIPRWARTNTAFPCGPAPSAPPPRGTVIFPSSTTENMNARMDACTVRPTHREGRGQSSHSLQDVHTHARCTRTRTRAHTHTHTHTRTRARAHTHTHTHTHTHRLKRPATARDICVSVCVM